MPRWVDCKRATFKYGLGDEFINILKVLHTLGLDRTEKVRVKGVEVSPRDVVAAVLPDPATVGPRMKGKTCAGLWVTGKGKDGSPRSTYLYHVVDNEWTMREYGHQCVVWQTAINPVVALELLARGTWTGAGVLGPEAFDAVPFLELLTAYGSPWGMQKSRDRSPAQPRTIAARVARGASGMLVVVGGTHHQRALDQQVQLLGRAFRMGMTQRLDLPEQECAKAPPVRLGLGMCRMVGVGE